MKTWIALTLVALLGACAQRDISSQTYQPAAVGQINRTAPATVLDARPVQVAGNREIGAPAGAAVGAVVGSGVSGHSRGSIVGAIGGAIIGGMAGQALEANSTQQRGVEYLVETPDGQLMTIVQGPEPALYKGQKVLIVYGRPNRLIADPRGF